MGRPSTARIARARAFSGWFGGFCTHLDGEELILLLEEHLVGRPRAVLLFESSLVDKTSFFWVEEEIASFI